MNGGAVVLDGGVYCCSKAWDGVFPQTDIELITWETTKSHDYITANSPQEIHAQICLALQLLSALAQRDALAVGSTKQKDYRGRKAQRQISSALSNVQRDSKVWRFAVGVTESEKGARRLVRDADPISAGWSGSRAEAASARELCWVIQDGIRWLRVSRQAGKISRNGRDPSEKRLPRW